MNKLARKVEKIIIYSLIIMMAGILILATVELGYYLIRSIVHADYFLIDLDELMDLFGVFMLVLIGIELLDTIKVYLRSNIVHVEVVVLVAIIAVARKVIALETEDMSGDKIIGIGVLIIALGFTYYLIKRAGLMSCKMDDDKADPREALGKGDEDEI
ncbi:MAG TPA: phosphate-starvation-inducible PsiE family protein [Bacteroidales bacterium]|nr:phosphate-starvation-inducible PsiE family protein [Bacteroidales bacterium]